MKRVIVLILIFIILVLVSCKNNKNSEVIDMQEIIVKSSSFSKGEFIPTKYTCDGENISPQIIWSNIPKSTKSLAIICDDPDAPMGTWIHWVLFNIPPSITQLEENIVISESKYKGIKAGINDFGKLSYGGPCPPGGTHRYFFKVYALNIIVNANEGITKKDLLKLMNGHIVGRGELMGKYKR